MTHQQVGDFVIDVFEAAIYDTPFLGGFLIIREELPTRWVLTREEDIPYFYSLRAYGSKV